MIDDMGLVDASEGINNTWLDNLRIDGDGNGVDNDGTGYHTNEVSNNDVFYSTRKSTSAPTINMESEYIIELISVHKEQTLESQVHPSSISENYFKSNSNSIVFSNSCTFSFSFSSHNSCFPSSFSINTSSLAFFHLHKTTFYLHYFKNQQD